MIERYNIHHLINYMQFSNTDWCKSEDVENLEEQNKQLLDALIKCMNEYCYDCTDDNISPHWNSGCSGTCEIGKILIPVITSITGKKPEE